MIVRSARPDDHAAITAITRVAFGGDDEVALIERLRHAGDVLDERIAEQDDGPVGHILFSALTLDPSPGLVAALAPLAVLPSQQRQGVGTALVRAGIDAMRARGAAAIVVLGHPDYYPRFGFSAATAAKLIAPFSGAAFMALELARGALARPARLGYPAAFGLDAGGAHG